MNSNWSYSPETLNSDQNQRFIVPCDLDIWRMTLKSNRAPLLCYFKLYASFHSQQWIQTKVTVRKCSILVKISDFFLSRVTLIFDRWPWKAIGLLFNATSSFVHHFVAIGEFKLELQSGNAQFWSKSTIFWAVWSWNLTEDLEKQQGTSPKQHQALCIIPSSYVNSNWIYSPETAKLGHDLCDLGLWPITLTSCMDVTYVIGNNSWQFRDDAMMGTYSKRCDGRTDGRTGGRTDRRTDWTIHRAAWSQLKTLKTKHSHASVVHIFRLIDNTKMFLT